MTDIPTHAEPIDPIALKTRELIEEAERAVATHDGDLAEFARQTLIRLSDQTQKAMSAYLSSLICLGLGPDAFMPTTRSADN